MTNSSRGLPPLPLAVQDAVRQVDACAGRARYEQAIHLLEPLLAQSPGRPELLQRQAQLLLALRRFVEAAAALEALLDRVPGDAGTCNALGSASAAAGNTARAIAAFRRACELAPQRGDYWYNLGRALDAGDEAEQACRALRRAIELMPRDHRAWVALAGNLRVSGDLDGSAAGFREAIRLQPDFLPAWTGLVDLKTSGLQESELEQLARLHAQAPPDSERRVGFGFMLGQALESRQEYAQAYAVLVESNAAKSRQLQWQPDQLTRYVDSIQRVFAGEVARAGDDRLGSEVVFLIGMPRSGSTLVEQVLAAHPDIEGGGERLDAHAVIAAASAQHGRDLFDWASGATPAQWAELGQAYLARSRQWRRQGGQFTDKQLDNWRYVGVLHAMLPGARFVFCRRNPLEMCWSGFKHNFVGGQAGFACDFDHLARYWQDMSRLLGFWQRRYPGLILEHVHEDFVADPEPAVRRLLAHCGRAFDPACLRFHEARRSVRTASAGQVRQPLQRARVAASNYGHLLDPLRQALDAPTPARE